MQQVHEIHKYKGGSFMYVVARTNEYSAEHVKGDADRMNDMLTPDMKGERIRYAFARGTIESMNKTGERPRKKDKQAIDGNTS
ncbi:MAG: hypothetical protein ACREA4_11595 [Nitrososphaera sp.]